MLKVGDKVMLNYEKVFAVVESYKQINSILRYKNHIFTIKRLPNNNNVELYGSILL